MIEIRGFNHQDGSVAAHVHMPGHGCASFSWHDVGAHHPALAHAIGEVERCITGAIILQSQEVAGEAMPESPEVDIALCKVCKEPVSMTTPGVLRNGPFVYCPKHSK